MYTTQELYIVWNSVYNSGTLYSLEQGIQITVFSLEQCIQITVSSLEQGIQITVSSLEQGGNRVKFTTTLALDQGRLFQP